MAQPNWITPAGSIGSFPAQVSFTFPLSAMAVVPATAVSYKVISGSLPAGVSMSITGIISGTPGIVIEDTTTTFVVRATDDLGSIRDRTFSMVISGVATPKFVTPTGLILSTWDSVWVELPIEFNNPVSINEVQVRLIQGLLPPGLEINNNGLIRGYAAPPISNVNLGSINTAVISASSNIFTGLSTAGFRLGRPIIFTGSVIGGIQPNQVYYIHSIIDEYNFTISTTVGGPLYNLTDQVGYMNASLPNVSVGQPIIQTYSFTLKLDSLLGTDLESYSITVINQNAPASEGGPELVPNTRVPTIYNTRPPTFNISADSQYYDYYVLPSLSSGNTYATTTNAYMGSFASDNLLSFKVMGHDFDGNMLGYLFAGLPLGLVGNSTTGWITGNPIIADNTVSEFSFRVAVYKASNPSIITPFFNFSFRMTNNINGNIEWLSFNDLGIIENSSTSTLTVSAVSDTALKYRLVEGELPPNLSLTETGEIIGRVAYQPQDYRLSSGDESIFTFSVQAYSPIFPVVQSTKTFNLTVSQTYTQPTDTLYIKCTPSINDRNLLRTLLDNNDIIPQDCLYRPQDPNFGKATEVVYVHAYGIFSNSLDAYVAAVTKNHYWRNITLGEIKTAVAKNQRGEVIYEVVYSSIIDNLVNPQGTSISKEVYWPRFINLNLGPWYTSVSNIYTSYIEATIEGQLLITEQDYYLSSENDFIIESESGQPNYYTSRSPGQARLLYPNSLFNMREQVGDELGQEFNYQLYPSWMTSQQANGNTLGFTPAWVICYTKPGFAETVKNNIVNNWKTPLGDNLRLNQINFKIDRFIVDKELTYDYDNGLSPPTWLNLPSSTPPDPKDSKNFFVLFPRETILPNNTQY